MEEMLYLSNDYFLNEKGGKVVCNITPLYFVREQALQFGSSIEGRIKAMTFYTGYKSVLPLVISDKYHIYYLCTRSYKAKDAKFINYDKLLYYTKINDSTTRLSFMDGIQIDIDVNYRIIKRQLKIIRIYLQNYHQTTKFRL